MASPTLLFQLSLFTIIVIAIVVVVVVIFVFFFFVIVFLGSEFINDSSTPI